MSSSPMFDAASTPLPSASNLVTWGALPDSRILNAPNFNTPYPEYPLLRGNDYIINKFYPFTMKFTTPLLFSLTYFTSVHLLNKVVYNRQVKAYQRKHPEAKTLPEKLPAASYWISRTKIFKILVLVHNILLCTYSVVTFAGMVYTMSFNARHLIPEMFGNYFEQSDLKPSHMFWQSVCNIDNGIWQNHGDSVRGLAFWGYLFYLSKFYEIIDTMIILLKGRQASLLQSYHHAGAILCMWAGVRFSSPPIWIFVVFNSFIHSIMYFYFTLSCLKIRVPFLFKQYLTTLQIIQFVVGGLLAVLHMFVRYRDIIQGTTKGCINSGEEALAIYMNVIYLTPLTLLFGAFYIDSYKKKRVSIAKKND
ncbi:DEKNAAC105009 [Brettanomyces naardenensis]|uniref:Elongation of fatty acids protein n=1 Tax=Brettanomyces naardenensis TaxID=13370 RepID=A0A448YRX2_BRENA|nr:DEKNAAC105009 [Brettanomyces naardenensis]